MAAGAGDLTVQQGYFAGAGNRAMQRQPDDDESQIADRALQPQQGAVPDQTDAGTPLPESPHLSDNSYFHRGTQALDAVTGLAGARGGADFVGASDAIFGTNLGQEVADAVSPNLLPGAGLLTTMLGMGESAVRAGDARDRSSTMASAARTAHGERAQEVLQLGAEEQTREHRRHTARGGAGALQSLLMGGGLVAGVTTGGTVPLAAATAIGGMKVAETVYNLARRTLGKEASQHHAMQLLFAAQAGDPAVVAALDSMGVPTQNLEDKKVWEAAVERLGNLMPKEKVEYGDAGAARSGPAVPIEERRALQPRLPGDQPYGSVSSEDAGTPGNPLGGQPSGTFDMADADANDGFADEIGGAFGQPPPAFASAFTQADGQQARDGNATPPPGQAPPLAPWLRPSARAENVDYGDSDQHEEGLAQAVYIDDAESEAESQADAAAAPGRRRET